MKVFHIVNVLMFSQGLVINNSTEQPYVSPYNTTEIKHFLTNLYRTLCFYIFNDIKLLIRTEHDFTQRRTFYW